MPARKHISCSRTPLADTQRTEASQWRFAYRWTYSTQKENADAPFATRRFDEAQAWGWLELASGAYQLQRERPAAALVHFKRAWRIWRPWGTDTIKETEQLEARREKTRAGLWLGEAWARVMSDRAPQATHAVLRAALAEIARIQAYDLLQETLMQQATLPPAPPGSPAYQQPVPYIRILLHP